MRRFYFLIFWLFAAPVHGQETDIQSVIADQLRAFNDRDVLDAWQYAAPNIQGLFGTPQNFGIMVERGYPMVWTNRDVQFLEQFEQDEARRQIISLTDPAGRVHLLEYFMVPTSNGWRIAGVQLLPSPDVGV